MRILLASSEVFPYSKSGGLADMVGALAKFLARSGDEVSVVTPLYRGIREKFPGLEKFAWTLDLPLGPNRVRGDVWVLRPQENLTLYFIEQPFFYDRAGLYSDGGFDYPDNAARFVFLSKAAVNLARYLPAPPEIVHVHDWQVGLVPVLILHQRLHEGWGNPPHTVLTLHNMAYQGHFRAPQYELTNLSIDYFHPNGVEFHGGFNCLKAGISYADLITTVSPRYAREITTEEYGAGLDGALRRRRDHLVGILNGVDYDEWNTTSNRFLPAPYSSDDLRGKALCKAALQEELGLPVRADVPLFGNITRLAEQKGVDIQLGALEEMLAADIQFVLLGSGSSEYERGYQKLAVRYPKKAAIRIGYDHALSHRIEAGSDFYLMPSRFEPCGLNQMYSLRYGTIPIVRVTGGLDDSVVDIAEDTAGADGIKFKEYSVRALSKAIRKAMVIFANAELTTHFRHNGMTKDFSWDRTAHEYDAVYRKT